MNSFYQKKSVFTTPFNEIYSKLLNLSINAAHYMELDSLKFLPLVCLTIAHKESVIVSDLASFIAPKLGIHFDSAIKKINRFFSNQLFDFTFFSHKLISNLISSYKIKHPDKKVHIIFDHEFIKKRYAVLMFTLKIGKQSIPLWFRVFDYHDKIAFNYSTFKEAFTYCHDLIKNIDPDANIIFLADRFWGNHFKLMDFIDDLGDTYYFRAKGDTVVFEYDKKENHVIKKTLSQLNSFVYHSKFYEDIPVSNKRYHLNLAISKSNGHKESFYILTNSNPKHAVKNYGYRYGGIEFGFKAQKSNGFFLEESQLSSISTFNALYNCVCISQLILTVLGIDYAKNPKCYKNYKIINARVVSGKRRKNYSFFRVGLILLDAAIDGTIKILNRFILYDV